MLISKDISAPVTLRSPLCSSKRAAALLGALFSISLLPHPLSAQQQPRRADWAVPDAALRADVVIRERPADPDLGVYVQLPDGGLLPKFPVADVRDADGQPLESLVLWHTPADALGLVFRPPAAKAEQVTVYIRAAPALLPRPAASSLKPSLFVFTRSGNPSLDNAKKMASEWPPAQGATAGQIDRIGIRWNPFGPDDHFSSWFTGWFKLDKRETVYLATISDEGSEIHLNGALHAAWPGIHDRTEGAQGKFGKRATLDPGWHRIDYFHFEVTGDQEMCLVWKREGDGDKLPYYMEKVWGKTGRADPVRLTAADNRAVGWVSGNLHADGYLWLANNPVHLHTLSCNGVRPAADLKIAWDFGQGRVVENAASCPWLVVGGAAAVPTAVLTVTSPAGVSRQTFRLTSFVTPRKHTLNKAADRLLYRQTFLSLVQAVPKDKNPCAAWTGDLWATLVDILDTYKGGPILMELFNRGWPSVQALPKEQRHVLEDRFAETLRLAQDTAKQLDWIDRFEKNDRDRGRQFRWREERISCHLYDQGDIEAARRAARFMRDAANSPEEIQRAVLRLGDVERLAGDRDQAARFYADAQERYRSRNRLGTSVAGGQPKFQSSRPVKAGESPNKSPQPLRSVVQDLKRSDAWKLYAVNDAAQSSTIRTYLDQDAVAEAFATLTQWENDTPMSKIGGDFPMTEARVYAYVGDFRRAAAILAAYRRADLMTSQLPEAMDLHLEAMMQLKRFQEARTLAEEALKRFPGLPVAERAESVIWQTRTFANTPREEN